MSEFQERFKVQIGLHSTGATTEQVTPYYDMRGYRRVDFLVEGLVQLPASGALGGATALQQFTCRVLQATDSTGGGATAMSSATAVVGKNVASGISSAAKCREGLLNFSTIHSSTDIQVTVAGAVYTSSTSGSAANLFACAASLAATVASEGFAAMFNSTSANTATAVTAKWQAATMAGAWLRIIPKDPDGTDLLTMSATGTQIGVGGVFPAHIGVDAQFLKDGCRYVALGVKSTTHANPYTVTIIREKAQGPVTPVTYSKTIAQSTSK